MHHGGGQKVSLGVSGSSRQSDVAPRRHPTSRPLGHGWATSRPLGRRLTSMWRTGGGSTGGWVLRGRSSPSATWRRTRGSQLARPTATRASCGAHRARRRHNRLGGLRGSAKGGWGASGSPGGPPRRGGGATTQISTATGGRHRRRQRPATATSSRRALRAWASAASSQPQDKEGGSFGPGWPSGATTLVRTRRLTGRAEGSVARATAAATAASSAPGVTMEEGSPSSSPTLPPFGAMS